MPMYRDFVPRSIRPWIYVCFAVIFQFTGGVYIPLMAQMQGGLSMMHEDVLMCAYCGLVGIIIPFPMLFRFKFRFTNRQILLTASLVIAACNWLALQTESVPLLCLICLVSGFFKLCGTFECFSNIQLWMTPTRDFAVFFPILYFIVVGDIQLSGYIITHIAYLTSWQLVHYFVIGLLLALALTVFCLTRNFRFMKPLPLYGLDPLGIALWVAVMVEVLFVFTYGEHYNWLNGEPIRVALGFLAATLFLCLLRMVKIRHPFLEPAAWKYRCIKRSLLLFFTLELLMAPSHVLQEAMGGLLGYDLLTSVGFNLWTLLGIAIGAGLNLFLMKHRRVSYITLTCYAFIPVALANVWIYFFISPEMNSELLRLPSACYGFSQVIIYVTLTIYLEEEMQLFHFFQGLTIIGIVRTALGMAITGAVYAFALRYLTADNLANIAANFDSVRLSSLGLHPGEAYGRVMASAVWVSIRQLYGWASLFGIAFTLFVFLYVNDTPVRSTLKRMPNFPGIGHKLQKQMTKALRRAKMRTAAQ